MITTILLLSIFFANSTFAQQTNQTMNVGGVTRDYIQYLPAGFNPSTESLPAVFVLHGLGGTAASMTAAGLNYLADTARIIVVYPQGVNNASNQPSWNNGTLYISSTADDQQFFSQMMDNYILNFNADISSIYMTGLSMGSIMSHHLACTMNNRIAAIGTMSGTMATSDISYYTSNPLAYKTPVIHLHGTADPTVPYDSGALPSLSLVPETMAFWRGQHGCANTSDSIRKPDTANDGITIDQFIYHTCDQEDAVELWRFNNAGHVYLYEPVNDITEAIEVWLFLRKWHHPNALQVGLSELNDSKINVYPNPSKGKITIKGTSQLFGSIYNIGGSLVSQFQLESDGTADLSNLNSGVYFLYFEGSDKPIKIMLE